jgi:hypothetical protein
MKNNPTIVAATVRRYRGGLFRTDPRRIDYGVNTVARLETMVPPLRALHYYEASDARSRHAEDRQCVMRLVAMMRLVIEELRRPIAPPLRISLPHRAVFEISPRNPPHPAH